MKKFKELIISGVTIFVLLAFLFHEPFLMPMGIQMLLITTASVLFLALATLLFRENPKDEREKINSFGAGRFSFLIGSVVLLTGIVHGIINHNINPYLPLTLALMLLSKIIYALYSDWKK